MAKVVIHHARMREWLYTNPGAQAGLAATGEAVRDSAKEEAPVGVSLSWPKKKPGEPWIRRPMRHGRFRDSIRLRKMKQFYRVLSLDPFGPMIEYGTVKNPPYATFRKTLRKFGGTELVKDDSGESG